MDASDNNVVDISDLHFQRQQREIFAGVNITIPRGKIVAIMGPSGCGKTTLLRLIGGQLQPQVGRVLVNGINVHRQSTHNLYELRKRMGLLFQSGALFTDMNVFDNVAFPLREHTTLPQDMIRDLVLLRLQSVGLRGAGPLMTSELSGGMARRVAMARSLMLDPELMMYDEPFTGQDPITMAVLVQLIKRLNKALGLTSIIVSHDVPETASIADYIYLLGHGKVLAEGTSEELLRADKPFVKQFVHGDADGDIPFHYPAGDFAEELLQ